MKDFLKRIVAIVLFVPISSVWFAMFMSGMFVMLIGEVFVWLFCGPKKAFAVLDWISPIADWTPIDLWTWWFKEARP